MSELVEIPIFPLRTVLFPDGLLPLRIFEARYVDMTKACIAGNEIFGVCMITEGDEVGAPAVPATIGCSARIVHWDVPSPGLFSLITRGERVFRIRERFSTPSGLIRALVELDDPLPRAPLPPELDSLRSLVEQIVQRLGRQNFAEPLRYDDAIWLSHRLAEFLPLASAVKLDLLGQRDSVELLVKLCRQIDLDAPRWR